MKRIDLAQKICILDNLLTLWRHKVPSSANLICLLFLKCPAFIYKLWGSRHFLWELSFEHILQASVYSIWLWVDKFTFDEFRRKFELADQEEDVNRKIEKNFFILSRKRPKIKKFDLFPTLNILTEKWEKKNLGIKWKKVQLNF